MTKYVGVLLLANGTFCLAPAWSIHEGDFVGLPDVATGECKALEVLSVVTDEKDGDFVQMLKRYVGFDLPKVTQRYKHSNLIWEDENDVQE